MQTYVRHPQALIRTPFLILFGSAFSLTSDPTHDVADETGASSNRSETYICMQDHCGDKW